MLGKNEFMDYRRTTVKAVTTTVTLAVYERTILVTNGTYSITLPAVAQCVGMLFTFVQLGAGTGKVRLIDAGDDPSWSDLMINAQYGKMVILSDGICWHALAGTAYVP